MLGEQLRCGGRVLDLAKVAIMGVLNVTPDSFSDGGKWLDPQQALEHGRRMAGDGASIIDVGGESTRPGAAPVDEEEELRRVLPVIEGLSSLSGVFIAVDTRKPAVARRAIEAGASLVNDTAGEDADPVMDEVVESSGAGICVMHSRGTPSTMRTLTDYSDVVKNVRGFLTNRAQVLQSKGVSADSICLDPGFGFAKSHVQSLEMLRRLEEIDNFGSARCRGNVSKIVHRRGPRPGRRRASRRHCCDRRGRRSQGRQDRARARRAGDGEGRSHDRGDLSHVSDALRIRDLRVPAHIGVTADERAVAQHLLIDLDIYADLSKSARTDELADTLDYDALVASVAELVKSTACRLLENLAARIAESVAADPRVQSVIVEIAKERPPVAQDVGSISVRLERWAG